MKQIWNNSLTNYIAPADRSLGVGGGFRGRKVFRIAPNNEVNLDTFNWETSATTNTEVSQSVAEYTQNVSQQVGQWTANASVDNAPVWSDYIPPRVDGFFSRNSQRFWRLDAQIIKRLFPERHLAGHITDVVEHLNIANQNSVGRYSDVFNALHQQIEPTVRYVRNGHNMDQASLFDMDMVEHLAKEVDSYRQQKIKRSHRIGRKVLKNRSWLRKFRDNLNPLNWPNKWQLNKSARNNSARSRLITKGLLAKAEDARERLQADVEQVYANVEIHRQGWKNRYENDPQKTAFYQFVHDVIHHPNAFLTNNGFPNPYNFAEIFGTNSRVRVLDVIVLKGYADQVIEEERVNQYSRDMTANLTNLNTREINGENTIQELQNDRVERLYDHLPDTTLEGENAVNPPSDEDLSRDLLWEIIRIERKHTAGFDPNTEIFAGQGRDMTAREKIPYLLNYIVHQDQNGNYPRLDRFVRMATSANPEHFAGLKDDIAKRLKAWLHQFREAETGDEIGISQNEWQSLQTDTQNIITNAQNALTICNTIHQDFDRNNQGNLPGHLGSIKTFINSFGILDIENRISRIRDNHKGVFADFLVRIKTIRDQLADFVTKAETAYAKENDRMSKPVPDGAGGTRMLADPGERHDLAVTVPLTLDPAMTALLNNLNTAIQQYNYPTNNGGNAVRYDKLRVHLSTESKKSRENQFKADLTYNSIAQWDYWQTALEGKVIPLLQGERADYVEPTYTLANATDFNDLLVVENRGGQELILQDDAGEYLYILRPEGEKENARLVLYKMETPVGQHGVNVPKETVSVSNAKEKYYIYNIAASDLGINANPLLNAA